MRRVALLLCALLAGCGGSSSGPSAPSARRAATAAAANATARPGAGLVARKLGQLPAAVQLPAVAALQDGSALVMGGLDAADTSTDNVWLVGPHGGGRTIAHLPQPVHDAGGAGIGQRGYLIGGGTATAPSNRIVRVRANGIVDTPASLPVGLSDVAAASVGRTVYAVGGFTGRVPLRSILAFTPGRHLATLAGLPSPVRYAAVGAAAGRVVIAGGTVAGAPSRDVYAFDPATNRVRRIARLPIPLTHAAGAGLNGRFYVIGGRSTLSGGQQRSILAIDPLTGAIRRAGRLPLALSDAGAASFAHRIVVMGGVDSSGRVHSEVLGLSPAAGGAAGPSGKTAAVPSAAAAGIYAADRVGGLSPTVRNDPALVYVPNSQSDTVDVVAQASGRIVGHFATGGLPQHVTPSWDLRTLYVTNDSGNSLTPIDPRTGRPGRRIHVIDPYNLYFTADGRRAIVVAEAHRALEFYTPHAFRLMRSLAVPQCAGVDHMDFTADGRMALVSCEFAGRMIVVDLVHERLIKTIGLRAGAMPQDVKISPDGRTFYVADMASGGVWLIDARTMRKIRFQPTGAGAHGLYPSRDARVLYVSNRGEGSISLISFRSRRPFRKWRIPGGGSPDMGGVSADGRVLWLTGRFNSSLYAISTADGHLIRRIAVGGGPHGACVWPQPGRYSIGHTGILR